MIWPTHMCSWVVCKPDVMVSISICHETNYQLFTFKHPMAFTGLWLYILDYFLYTHTHTCTCTRTHIPMHTHSQAYVHTHTVHMIGRQKGMIHLRDALRTAGSWIKLLHLVCLSTCYIWSSTRCCQTSGVPVVRRSFSLWAPDDKNRYIHLSAGNLSGGDTSIGLLQDS